MTDRWILLSVFIALILFCPTGLGAATLSGKVMDARGNPVSNATVSVGEKFEFTDVYGRYRIREAPAGTQKIQVKQGKKILMGETVEITDPGVKKDLTVP
ncbi:MAG: carboxypeptidase regulatory-like domain-containing protein [Nitrospirae bacterium]|nr:carboxypeptidase regulatory-like domain-containing protein [Nitrospirota bacterium]